MNIDIKTASNTELESLLVQLSVQEVLATSTKHQIVQELLTRQEELRLKIQQTHKPIVLPQLKKVTLPKPTTPNE